MKATIAGKEYNYFDHASLRMMISANTVASLLQKQLKAFGVVAESSSKDDAEYAKSMTEINEAMDRIDDAFKNFCRCAFVETVDCSYFDLSQEEAAELWRSFFGGFTATTTPN